MAISNEQVVALLKKNPIITGCAIVSILLVGAIFYRADAIPLAQDELDKTTAEAARYEANLKNASQLEDQYQNLVASTAQIEARMLRVDALAINQQYFYKLASETGVALKDPSQGKPSGKYGTFVALPYTLTLEGSLAQVLTFLRRLESGEHFARTMSASLAPSGKEFSEKEGVNSPLYLTVSMELLAAQ